MLSIIVPIHNEEKIIALNVPRLAKALEDMGSDHEIILAEDGSTDNSLEVAKKLQSGTIRIISSEKRLGRGLALRNAISQAHGEIIIYMDADLATDLRFVPSLVDEINAGADICTGSRLLMASNVYGRSLLRGFLSKCYNLLLRILFVTSVKDHQCGFKAFRKSAIMDLLDEVEDRHWFWDSELLIRAQAKGLKVKEIPVDWTDRKDSGVRLHSDILYMFLAALKLRYLLSS